MNSQQEEEQQKQSVLPDMDISSQPEWSRVSECEENISQNGQNQSCSSFSTVKKSPYFLNFHHILVLVLIAFAHYAGKSQLIY